MRELVRTGLSNRDIVDLLFELAQYTLCRSQNHQIQAEEVSTRWYRTVRSHIDDIEERLRDASVSSSEGDDNDASDSSEMSDYSDSDSESDSKDDNDDADGGDVPLAEPRSDNDTTTLHEELAQRLAEITRLQQDLERLRDRFMNDPSTDQRSSTASTAHSRPPVTTEESTSSSDEEAHQAEATPQQERQERARRAAEARRQAETTPLQERRARARRAAQAAEARREVELRRQAEARREREAREAAEEARRQAEVRREAEARRQREAQQEADARQAAEEERRAEALRQARREAAEERARREEQAEREAEEERARHQQEQNRSQREREAEAAQSNEDQSWESAWAKYEAAWSSISYASVQLDDADIHTMGIWPTRSGSYSSCCEAVVKEFFAHRPEKIDRKALRRQFMRWHPDRAERLFSHVRGREGVLRIMVMVSQVVNEVMGACEG